MACSEDCGRKKGDRLIKGNNQSKSKKKDIQCYECQENGHLDQYFTKWKWERRMKRRDPQTLPM